MASETIKNLPLLPSDWSLWDWTTSNGNATQDQLTKAYHAITSKGLCSDFSRIVWNDLVNATANALNAAGISWKTTYGTVSSCKINSRLDMLTASAFNALALNIRQLGFVNWKWSMHDHLPGYTGRDAFRGYSTYGTECDYLYGWHILELANKLNILITVLKGEADFSEFEGIYQATAPAIAPLISCQSAPIDYSGKIIATPVIFMDKAAVLAINAHATINSHNNSLLAGYEPKQLLTYDKGITNAFATAERMAVSALSCAQKEKTFVESSLTDLVRVGYMQYRQAELAFAPVEMDAAESRAMESDSEIKSKHICNVEKFQSRSISASCITTDKTIASLVYNPPVKISAEETIASHADAEIMNGIPRFAESTEKSNAFSLADINAQSIKNFTFCKESKTVFSANAKSELSVAAASFCNTKTRLVCDLDLEYVAHDHWRDPIQTGSNLYIRSAYPQWREENTVHLDGGVWYDPVQTGSNLYIKSIDSMKGIKNE